MQKTCSCGQKYWPAQRWIHEKCLVNHQEPATNVVVNARTKDRHKKTPERLEYVKQKMREYRARRG
jgi:hypothetical protein